MKIIINEETPVQNARRIASELENAIDVRQQGRSLEGSTMNQVFLATIEQAQEAAPFARTVLRDQAIADAVELLEAGAPQAGYARSHAISVAYELRRLQSQSWRDTKARQRAEAEARNAPAPPSKRIELLRDHEGRVVGADVWGA